jgi:hypothetical protein
LVTSWSTVGNDSKPRQASVLVANGGIEGRSTSALNVRIPARASGVCDYLGASVRGAARSLLDAREEQADSIRFLWVPLIDQW